MMAPLAMGEEIYKCIDSNGNPRFSQHPCDGHAETVTIETPNALETQPVDEAVTSTLTHNRHLRELDAAIRDKGYELDVLAKERDRELAELESRRSDAGRYLVMSVTDYKLDEEIQAAQNRYRREIARVQAEQDRLIAERQRLAAEGAR
ncbi:DUF4124 domain-containing protein [Pseudomaricurvus sp. HS19]|nr:DUF4124 domain-containing protein [Pseudomaricurvus sp. HS19]